MIDYDDEDDIRLIAKIRLKIEPKGEQLGGDNRKARIVECLEKLKFIVCGSKVEKVPEWFNTFGSFDDKGRLRLNDDITLFFDVIESVFVMSLVSENKNETFQCCIANNDNDNSLTYLFVFEHDEKTDLCSVNASFLH